MRSFYFQNYFDSAQTNEQRVKNAHAGTLINKNVIIPPQPPHPPPHPPAPPHPTPPHPPEQTLPCQHATINATNSVKQHSKTRGKCNDAHENKTARDTNSMLRQWQKHEKVSKTHDALEGTLPKTTANHFFISWWHPYLDLHGIHGFAMVCLKNSAPLNPLVHHYFHWGVHFGFYWSRNHIYTQ